MANGSSFSWVVNVIWQAIPDSMNYFDLGLSDMEAVNRMFIGQVDALVPPGDQARWRNLVFTVTNFDELVTKVRAVLKREFSPPAGTELLLAEVATIWKPRPPNGHEIEEAAMLKDTGATTTRQWSLKVSHGGVDYSARMGLTYECAIARMP